MELVSKQIYQTRRGSYNSLMGSANTNIEQEDVITYGTGNARYAQNI